MRQIDADVLEEHKFTRNEAKGNDYMRGWNDAIEAYKSRPHGQWVEGTQGYYCSECETIDKSYYEHYFCPKCGADMGEKDDE